MKYKIEYSPETAHLYPQKNEKKRKSAGNWLIVVFLVAAILWVRLNGIPDFMIPGNKEVTRHAAATLMENLQEGSTMNEAVTVFCQTILEHAGF